MTVQCEALDKTEGLTIKWTSKYILSPSKSNGLNLLTVNYIYYQIFFDNVAPPKVT